MCRNRMYAFRLSAVRAIGRLNTEIVRKYNFPCLACSRQRCLSRQNKKQRFRGGEGGNKTNFPSTFHNRPRGVDRSLKIKIVFFSPGSVLFTSRTHAHAVEKQYGFLKFKSHRCRVGNCRGREEIKIPRGLICLRETDAERTRPLRGRGS